MNNHIPPNTICKSGDSVFLGSHPIRQEITVLPADDVGTDKENMIIISSSNVLINKKRILGWSITEAIGPFAFNTKSIKKLLI